MLTLQKFTVKSDFQGGIHKKPIQGKLPKKGGLKSWQIQGQEGEGLVKNNGVETLMNTM